jgi:hypothetical protein
VALFSFVARALGAIAAAVVLAVLVAVAGAAGAGVLHGSVKDAEGKPVEGAVVMAMLVDSDQAPRAVGTDAQGTFRVAGLAAGTYRVGVRKAGFVSREFAAVEVGADGATLDVALQKPKPLAAIGPAPGGPASGGGVARAGGRSISITSVSKEEAEKEETGVLRVTVVDDLVLMEFLNQQAKDGREVVQVIPLDVGDSLFVTAPLGDRSKPAYLVLPVYEPIEEGRVKDRMGLQKGKTLLGLHRLSADSYALIFR